VFLYKNTINASNSSNKLDISNREIYYYLDRCCDGTTLLPKQKYMPVKLENLIGPISGEYLYCIVFFFLKAFDWIWHIYGIEVSSTWQ
jgi:hypothetical protein